VTFKAQVQLATGDMSFEIKPLSVNGCSYQFDNITTTVAPKVETSKSLHSMSYLYYTGFGAIVTLAVGMLSCLIFGTEDTSKIDPMLLAPFIRKYFTKKSTVNNIECIVHRFDDKNDNN
jgi:hypothetical protein